MKLYLRSRRTGITVLIAILVAIATFAGGMVSVPIRAFDETGMPVNVPFGILVPVVFSWFTSMGMHSRYAVAEALSTRPLWVARIAHALAAIAVGCTLIAIATNSLDGAMTTVEATRNYLLLSGLGLASASVISPVHSWILPTGIVVLYGSLGSNLPHNLLTSTREDGVLWLVAAVSTIGGVALYATARRRAGRRAALSAS